MFLKINLFMFLLMFGFLAEANRDPLPSKAGKYLLDPVHSNLANIQKRIGICSDFSLSKAALAVNKTILLGTGATYAFSTSKDIPVSHLDSDIPTPGVECVFDEYNTREDISRSETRLTKVNEELCRRPKSDDQYLVYSHTTMTATFTPNQIRLDFHKKGDQPFACVWNLKD